MSFLSCNTSWCTFVVWSIPHFFFSFHSFCFLFKLDVAFDGADEVDESLNLIKGGGYGDNPINYLFTLDWFTTFPVIFVFSCFIFFLNFSTVLVWPRRKLLRLVPRHSLLLLMKGSDVCSVGNLSNILTCICLLF